MRSVVLVLTLGALGCESTLPQDDTWVDDVDHVPSAEYAVRVGTASYFMGCNVAQVSTCEANELPYHEVLVSAFEIDRTEVTQAAYSRCLDRGACSKPTDNFDPIDLRDYPVTDVTWDQAQELCAWNGKRLPTEAEWELAARGTEGAIFPWGNAPPTCQRANYEECGWLLSEVGEHPAGRSPYGAEDMAGNVVEWVTDWYDEGAYALARDVDPEGPKRGALKVLRGGSFVGNTDTLRASYRGFMAPVFASPLIGFRCVRPLPMASSID